MKASNKPFNTVGRLVRTTIQKKQTILKFSVLLSYLYSAISMENESQGVQRGPD